MRRSAVVTVLTVTGGVAAAGPAGYLAALSVAATGHPKAVVPAPPARLRLAVLVPAHDEELLVGRCVDSLMAQDYPRDRFQVVVVADNCTDSTVEVARARGAEALERTDALHRGKGHALRWAMDRLVSTDPEIEAFVVVDADSVADPGLLRALVGAVDGGARVVQADYGALVDGDDDRAQLRAAAFLLFHRVRFSGKARLGLPCSLVGNGMLFTREVVVEHPWAAFSQVEDLEHSIVLRRAGIGPAFAVGGRLSAPVATTGSSAEVQRTRWEGGRLRLVRHHLPGLVSSVLSGRRPDLWDLVADLVVPPIGVLALGTAAGGAAATALRLARIVPTAAVVPWAVAGVALPTHVLVGLRAGDAPDGMRRALRAAPALVAGETRTRFRLLVGPRSREWVRTPRAATGSSPGAHHGGGPADDPEVRA